METAIQAQPTTTPEPTTKNSYGPFDIRSRVVAQYTHLISKTQPEHLPTLACWLVAKNMEFLWWIKTDLAKCLHLLEMIAEKNGIAVAEQSATASGPATVPDFLLSNGAKVTGPGTQASKKGKK